MSGSDFTFIDLFAGIGGTRLGFDRAFGSDAETVYVCELDPFARKTYFANFDEPSVVDSDIEIVPAVMVPGLIHVLILVRIHGEHGLIALIHTNAVSNFTQQAGCLQLKSHHRKTIWFIQIHLNFP